MDVAASRADNASVTIGASIESALNETFTVAIAAASDRIDTAVALLISRVPSFGECNAVGRGFRAVRTDICESFLGSITVCPRLLLGGGWMGGGWMGWQSWRRW